MRPLRSYSGWILTASACAIGVVCVALLHGSSHETSWLTGTINPAGVTMALTGAAVLGLWAIRKSSIKVPGLPWNRLGGIKIQGTCPLGQGRNLMVVEVEGERFLIWLGKERVGLLSRLSQRPQEVHPQEVVDQ